MHLISLPIVLCYLTNIIICQTTVPVKDRSLNEIKDTIDTFDNTIPTFEPQTESDNDFIKDVDTTRETSPSPGPDTTKRKPSTYRTTTKAKSKVDPMDQYLLDGLLQIVDAKFETINKRLMTLERGINSLQYYNVRSFRVVNTHLHAVDTILHGITSEINQVELKNRDMEQGLGGVKDELSDLQTLNTGMFQAIEQNLVYFHKDVNSQISDLKTELDVSTGQIGEIKNDTAAIKADVVTLKVNQNALVRNNEEISISSAETAHSAELLVNVTVGLLEGSTVTRMNTDTIKSSLKSISNNISDLTSVTEDIRNSLQFNAKNVSLESKEEDIFSSSGEVINDKKNTQELRVQESEVYMTCSKMFEYFDAKFKTIKTHQNNSCSIANSEDFKNESKTLLRALSVVNENVLQSVTIYRHAGDLFERVISETEFIASEQVKLREDIQEFVANNSMYLEYLSQINQTFQLSKADDGTTTVKTPTTTTSETLKDSRCDVSLNILDEVSKVTRNSTMLVELLTNLAETSTTTLKESLINLQTEVSKLHKLKLDSNNKHMLRKAFYVKDDPSAGVNSGSLKDLQNKTEWIYQLVEAVASNTGWIPYIFHNMRFIESQVNKTLKVSGEISERTEETLLRQRMDSRIYNKLTAPTMVPTTKLPNALENVLKKVNSKTTITQDPETTTKLPSTSDSRKILKSGFMDFNTSTEFGHMMEFVYDTNVKIDRLIPALTNLLGEPGN